MPNLLLTPDTLVIQLRWLVFWLVLKGDAFFLIQNQITSFERSTVGFRDSVDENQMMIC